MTVGAGTNRKTALSQLLACGALGSQAAPAGPSYDFVWRRDGQQVAGVLDGPIEERRKHDPGTCSYMTANGQMEFVADAEWVLSPDEPWLYDINLMAGNQFIGRHDKTHLHGTGRHRTPAR